MDRGITARRGRHRRCIERLERRELLTAAPCVDAVIVSSTQWSSSFLDYLEEAELGAGGYAVPAGSSGQLATVPWTNLDRIVVAFDQAVTVDRNDLAVTGVSTAQRFASSFSYDSSAYVATWTFAAPLGNDLLLLDLDSNGIDPVKNGSGHKLDGEWTNASSVFKSGNQQEGGDFEFRLNVLPGDVNQSTTVGGSDYTLVSDANGLTTGSGGYSPFYDVDGSGTIDSTDVGLVSARWGHALPSGTPAGLTNDAPTAAMVRSVSVVEDATDYVLSLWGEFEDAETSDSALTYQIVSNSNAALFTSTAINTANGNLTLHFAPDAFGTAQLQIEAVDTGGLRVTKTIDVDVASDNDQPEIVDFAGTPQQSPIWVFSGRVVDENPGGRTVTFGGLLTGHSTTTNSDGTFSLSVPLTTGGTVSATTTDPQGSQSAPVFVVITMIVEDPGERTPHDALPEPGALELGGGTAARRQELPPLPAGVVPRQASLPFSVARARRLARSSALLA